VAAASSKVIITADIGKRGGKTIHLKDIVNECRTKHEVEHMIQHVLVWERFMTGNELHIALNEPDQHKPTHYEMKEKDIRMDLLVAVQRPYSVPEWMDSEDPLFILYTSGSTGKPKGLVHTTGGYTVYASYTAETTFNLMKHDIFACVADCGWITGHTYVVYGPLLNGITTFVFESTPVYPNAGRYWDMITRHNITQFYTAPTAIRLLMKFGDTIPSQYDITKTCRVLGTVGEPINPEAWRWYYEVIGRKKCTIVDTYWQTETGGHIITNLPGLTPMKPGSCTLPLPGIEPIVLDPITGQPVTEPDANGNISGVLALKQPWPGMARTCLGDHQRYLQTYLHVYQGYYYTGDSVMKDKDGYYFIIGRVDDVLNVSGHRIGTAEVESALVAHAAIAQAAVVGQPHEIKGTSIVAFVMLKDGFEHCLEDQLLIYELKQLVRVDIGSFATPDMIICAPSLPMTRSGKIMRRILRKIVCHETDTLGDTSTLADPSIVDVLIQKVHDYHAMHEK
jgi:acetyl-CoA synthetase